MRIRTKLISAGAALGVLASYSLVALPQVGADDAGGVEVPITCLGADEMTQSLLDMGLEGHLELVTKVTPADTNPTSLATGEDGAVGFDVEMQLSPELIGMAVDVLGVDSIDIQDLDLGIVASGGGTGGPYAVAPSTFTVGLVPVSVPALTADGNVTIDDDSDTTLFSIANPVTFKVYISGVNPDTEELEELTLGLDCTAQDGFFFGPINGEAPEPPTTTAPPTTTTTIDTSEQTDSSELPTVCTFTATANGRDITNVVKQQMKADTLGINLKVEATTPKQLGAGQTGDVSFAVSMPMDSNTKAMAQNPAFGISSIELSNINLQITANGGGHGGPYKVLWGGADGYAANLTTFESPVGTASGTVTIDDVANPTFFTVVNPFTYTVTIQTSILGKIQMNNTCNAQAKGFGAINGTAPVGPPTPTPAPARFAG